QHWPAPARKRPGSLLVGPRVAGTRSLLPRCCSNDSGRPDQRSGPPAALGKGLRSPGPCAHAVKRHLKFPPLCHLKFLPPGGSWFVWGSARGNSPSPLHVKGQQDSSGYRLFELGLEQTGLELFLESEAFSFDVDCDRMVQQAVEDRAGDYGIAEHLAPRAET